MHLCFKMLNTGKQMLHTTTQNCSHLFLMMWSNQLYIIQASSESQNWLKMFIMDGNNIRGREGRVCVKEVVREGVENVVKAGSGFRIFPFASKDDIVCDVNKVLRHEDMMLKQNQALIFFPVTGCFGFCLLHFCM